MNLMELAQDCVHKKTSVLAVSNLRILLPVSVGDVV